MKNKMIITLLIACMLVQARQGVCNGKGIADDTKTRRGLCGKKTCSGCHTERRPADSEDGWRLFKLSMLKRMFSNFFQFAQRAKPESLNL